MRRFLITELKEKSNKSAIIKRNANPCKAKKVRLSKIITLFRGDDRIRTDE